MVNIYTYLKTSKFLKEILHKKKEKNPSFSLRAWALQLGLKSHGGLQQILAGKRTVPKKYIPQIVKSFNLSHKETVYFETLVDFEKAKTPAEKNIYYDRLNLLRPRKKNLKIIEIENYKFFKNPLHSVIRTMIDRRDFKNCAEWIKKHLRIKTSQKEIKDVIARLFSLGLVENTGAGLKKTHPRVQNKIDTPCEAVQEYHKYMSLLAAEEVKKQSIDQREYNSFCLNIKEGQIQNAQKKIRSFIDEFISEFEAVKNTSQETYQLNIQLFSLTKMDGETQ